MKVESNELLKILEALRTSAEGCFQKAKADEARIREYHRGMAVGYSQAIEAVQASIVREWVSGSSPQGEIRMGAGPDGRLELSKELRDLIQSKLGGNKERAE